ncbi:recombination directionality factor [Paraburkholderia sp. D1E]|uniref:recombination directionality factor n=1 Tax=Paraburkholderia sp. D1E TaxID=3461398 RepID=UPI00404676FA
MNAVLRLTGAPPRSIVEERALRPPTIGKIRPGIKVLKQAIASANPNAVAMYDEMVAAGDSFEAIDEVLESRFRLKNALIPRNSPYFTCRRSDFTNPDVASEILRLYGEDRGQGVKLYRFPVLFAFNDWMGNLPNQMTAWGTTGRKFFSEYGNDGQRYCKTYAKVERDPRAQRATRTFGGRDIIFRQDEAIPDGICDPERCPQYQSRQCNLSASFIFAIPDIKGLGLIELPTNSIYVLQKAYSAMQTVVLARGRLTGTRFWISKREFDITRIGDNGEALRAKQMLTVLDAEIDIGSLLDGADDAEPALEAANRAVALVEAGGNVLPLRVDGSIDTGNLESDVQVQGVSESPHVESQASFAGHSGNADGEPAARSPESGSLLAHVMDRAGEPPDGNADTESIEEKRDRMSDLLKRLGLGAEDRKHDFKVFAHARFGRGWVERVQDVDAMNARLEQALSAPALLAQEIAEARQQSLLI